MTCLLSPASASKHRYPLGARAREEPDLLTVLRGPGGGQQIARRPATLKAVQQARQTAPAWCLNTGQCSAGRTAGGREVRPHARGTSVTGCPPPLRPASRYGRLIGAVGRPAAHPAFAYIRRISRVRRCAAATTVREGGLRRYHHFAA